jgi:RNA polymerase sigma-70 factor (ECF subfamily)
VLAKIKSDHRRIIFLRTIEGFSIAETAAILGKTEAAVKMLLLRALNDLSEQLQKDAYFSARGAQ